MNKVYTHLDLELSSSNKHKIINVQQFDNNSRVLEINLYHQGKPYDLTGISCINLVGHRGDGAAVFKGPLEYDDSNNIYVTLTDDILCAKGLCELKLELYSGIPGESASRELLSSFPFKIRVNENVYDENKVLESPQYNKLQDKIDEVTLLETEVEKNMETIISEVQKNTTAVNEHVSEPDIHISNQERTLWNSVSDKVEKEEGKGLSSNNYSTEEKNKLAGIAENANNYTHPNSGSASGSYGDSTSQTPSPGESFKVPYISVNDQGHVTNISEHTVTLPVTEIVVDSELNTVSINPVQNKVIKNALDSKTDTKNTAGSTDTSSKIFLIGATSQASNPRTYSHDTAYIGTNGHVYSNGKQVVNLSDSQALTNKTYNGYTLATACSRGVTNTPTSTATTLLTSAGAYANCQPTIKYTDVSWTPILGIPDSTEVTSNGWISLTGTGYNKHVFAAEIIKAWPVSTWTGAGVTIVNYNLSATYPCVQLRAETTQQYTIIVRFFYTDNKWNNTSDK